MSNYQIAIDLIKQLSGQANVLTIPRVYADYMGSLDGGLLLSQIIYWSDKTKNPDGWFYKTYREWDDEIGLSKYEVAKQAEKLKARGVLETKVKKANGNPTVYYHLKMDDFLKSIVKFLDERKSSKFTFDDAETKQSLTEPTPEITPERDDEEDEGAGGENQQTADNQKWAEVYSLIENNLSTSIAPISTEEMKQPEYLKLPLQWWEEAIKIACDNNARRWAYLRSILDRSISAGVSPAALAEQKRQERNAGRPNGPSKPAPREYVIMSDGRKVFL